MADRNEPPLAGMYEALRRTGLVRRLLDLSRDEDLAKAGDVTSAACAAPAGDRQARIVARRAGIVAGMAVIPDLLDVFGGGVSCRTIAEDGSRIRAGEPLGVLTGPRAGVLAVERTLLNILGRLSGVAMRTAEFIAAVEGTGTRIYDTRKTTPGLRVLEKYAVRCGGGMCHRMGLHDAVLIKDNHLAGVGPQSLAQFVRAAAERARRSAASDGRRLLFVEVEVDSLDQLARLLTLDPGVVDILLLDNFDTGAMRRAVEMRDAARSRPHLEASGGVDLGNVRQVAETGVERISIGSITHAAAWLDVALDMDR